MTYNTSSDTDPDVDPDVDHAREYAHAQAHAQYDEWKILPITTLTSVATVIGSGILALPVTMYETTIPLFLFVFTIALFVQIAAVYATIHLLQRARVDDHEHDHEHDHGHGHDNISGIPPRVDTQPLREFLTPVGSLTDMHSTYSTFDMASREGAVPPPPSELSLVTLVRLYLPTASLRWLFHLSSYLTFVSLLVSYGLAGPQAIWQLKNPPPAPPTPPLLLFFAFSFLGTTSMVLFLDYLLPLFSTFTVIKGALFIAVVFIVALLPPSARISSFSTLMHEVPHWSTIFVPILMSTLALGGLPMTIPVTYRLLPPSPTVQQLSRYRFAVLLALYICYLLNIGWVIAILQVVPREAPYPQPSLTNAFRNGQISTVPLIETLSMYSAVSPRLLYAVELIVQLFILFSTGVSFFVIAAGFKNYMDGAAASVQKELDRRQIGVKPSALRGLAYLASFGPVVLMVMVNPQGFISVLTRFASTAENLQSGVLIFLMLYLCQRYGRARASATASADDSDDVGAGKKEMHEHQGVASSSMKVAGANAIALPLSQVTISVIVVLGSIYFSLAVLLAVFGPLVGIELNAPTE